MTALVMTAAAAERSFACVAIHAGDGRAGISIEMLALPATTIAAGCWT